MQRLWLLSRQNWKVRLLSIRRQIIRNLWDDMNTRGERIVARRYLSTVDRLCREVVWLSAVITSRFDLYKSVRKFHASCPRVCVLRVRVFVRAWRDCLILSLCRSYIEIAGLELSWKRTNLVGDPDACACLPVLPGLRGETTDYSYSHAVTVNDPRLQRSFHCPQKTNQSANGYVHSSSGIN